ncbi:tape measure protein [Enterococcus dispar]
MNNEDLVLKMILDESGFTSGMNNAVKKLGNFDGQVSRTGDKGGRSLGGIWTSFVGNFLASGATRIISKGLGMISSSVDGAINRVDTLNNSNRVFENMGFRAGETKKAMKNLEKSISGLPTPLDSAVQGMTALTATYDDIDLGQKVFSGLNNAILGFGGSTDMVNNAIMQLSQLPMDGPLDAQTWNSLRNSGLTPVLNAMAKESGMSMSAMKEAFGKGELTVEDFTKKLIDLNKNGGGGLKSLEKIAKDSTSGIKTGIANMKTAITRGVAESINKINEGLAKSGTSISDILSKVGSAFENGLKVVAKEIPPIIEGISNAFNFLSDNAEWLIPIISGVVGALTAVAAINSATNTITNITKAVGSLSTAFSFLMSPTGLIIIGIGMLVAAGVMLYKNWDTISAEAKKIWGGIADFFKVTFNNIKGWFSGLWEGAKEKASAAVEGVKNAWSNTKQWFGDLWQGIKGTASNLWQGTIDSAKLAVQGVKDAWSDTKQWFSDLWEGIKETASKLWSSFSETIMPYIRPLVDGIANAFSNVKESLTTIFSEISEIAGNAFEILKNIILAPVLFITSMISGGWEETKNNMVGIWNNIVEAAESIWLSIKTIITTYTTMLVDSVVGIATGWYQTLVNIFNGIKDWGILKISEMVIGVKSWWTNLVTSVKTFATDLKNFAIQAFQNMKVGAIQRATDLKNGAVNAWENLKNSIKQKATDLKNGAINTWQTLKTNVINTANNLVIGAENAWEKLKRGVSNTVNRVKNIFDDLKKINLFEIGKNIIDGLINGIQEKFGDLKKKVSDIAGTITSGLKNLLNIHSPSRLMRDLIGKNVILGIIEGIDQTSPKLKNSLDNLPFENTELPTVNLKSKVENNNLANETKASGSNAGTNENQEIHLHLTVYGDMPDSVVRQMAKKMKIELARLMQNDADAVGGVI